MVVNPRLLLSRLRQLAGENKLFSWALAAGALLLRRRSRQQQPERSKAA